MAAREAFAAILREIFLAGVAACDPEAATAYALSEGAVPDSGPVWILGAGKASAGMARAAVIALGERVSGGLVVVKDGYDGPVPGLEVICAGHPSPDTRSLLMAQRIGSYADRATAGETVLFLLSGGASSLLAAPARGIDFNDLVMLNQSLLLSGASISEINVVRKHLTLLGGGQLGVRVLPANLVTLVVSDVVGSPLSVIGSGPTVGDDSTFADAHAVLARYHLLDRLSPGILDRLVAGMSGHVAENPRTVPGHTRIVLDNDTAVRACMVAAESRGLSPVRWPEPVVGDAAMAGQVLVQHAKARPGCVIAGGETTVQVTGTGRGGRCQELALAAALALEGEENIALLSASTDGTDGPTNAAGAIAYGDTALRARALGLDPEATLAEHDAYPLFEALGDHVITGPTGTNVMDVQIVLSRL